MVAYALFFRGIGLYCILFVHMLSYSCLFVGSRFNVSFRTAVFKPLPFNFHGFHTKKKKGFVLPPIGPKPSLLRSSRRSFVYEEDEDADCEEFDEEDSDDLLLEELNNLNNENAKAVRKTCGGRSPMVLSGTDSVEGVLKHGKRNGHVIPMTGIGSARNGTSRIDSSVHKPSSLRLSRKEWEKRAIEIIQQQKLRRMAVKKKKTGQKIILKSSKPEDIDLLMGRSNVRSIAKEKKKAEQKSLLESSESKYVDLLIGNSMASSGTAILKEEVRTGKLEGVEHHQVTKILGCEAKCQPLIQYLSNLGFKEAHFVRIYDRHKAALHANVAAVQKRLDFLVSMGVKSEDLVKIITRQPQILEYTIDDNIIPHIDFLRGLGVPTSRLGKIITVAPYLLSYSVELSLKPKVKFLIEKVGIESKDLAKVVVLSPQILVQHEEGLKSRLNFIAKELGASKESLVKMVRKHPQLLHYSIKDGLRPRIEFLRSIGMSNADIVKVLTRLTQILSLSVEKSLRPKYLYLVKDLNNKVQSLTANPAYLSLSLDQRISPRHRFLATLKKVPHGPFPLTALFVTDDSFCEQWANSTLEEYEAFRKELQLSKLKRQLLHKYGARQQQTL